MQIFEKNCDPGLKTHGPCFVYIGKFQLSYPKSGASIESIPDIEGIRDTPSNTDNDEQETLTGAYIIGVQLEKLFSCVNCIRSIPTVASNIVICTNCETTECTRTCQVRVFTLYKSIRERQGRWP